ncbi:MAG TPA: hypothetical protein VNO70_17245 [Blastocatellia bacterium]|nr:hypothetical protein [Blastocatellia bacterium]
MSTLVAAITIGISAIIALGQGQFQEQINFTISVPHKLKTTEHVLPAGKYILKQADVNSQNLFALYPEDLTHPPIAMIRTARTTYQGNEAADGPKVILMTEGDEAHPTLRGWEIPGQGGWEIIGVEMNDK